ncbi:hypothetical protein CRE_04912 [Caenorhabditis remanei]|uniref:Uncharacterized protein n=1 Tax=Caenorhabditis remanei TaxID=31234 RepID=E3MNA3_CAERE|nr:hypothetical protein CRE_04912 [Caenorhabditis remanei]
MFFVFFCCISSHNHRQKPTKPLSYELLAMDTFSDILSFFQSFHIGFIAQKMFLNAHLIVFHPFFKLFPVSRKMSSSPVKYVLVISFLISIVSCRPPVRNDQEKKILGSIEEQMELGDYIDYFEDFFPVLNNSTKLTENYQYEKKKYLTSVGFPAKIKKML